MIKDYVRNHIVLIYTILALLFFILNPQTLKFDYGDGGGRYADRVDSFSEYIVRNTIKRNILNTEDNSFLPILTKGYPKRDYHYYGDDYIKYYSNVVLQTTPATVIAKLLNLNTERKLDNFFVVLRFTNALLFSFCLSLFLYYFCKSNKLIHHFAIPLVVGGSAGFVFYSQNLYFASALMVAPASLIAIQLYKSNKFSKTVIFLLGATYFLTGYEFATVFALLTAFSAAIFADGNWANKLRLAVVAFVIICASFVFSIILHVVLVSADSGWALSLSESAQSAFATLERRTASFDRVPLPFSSEFFQAINKRWSDTAFSLTKEEVRITELQVIIFMVFTIFFRAKKATKNEIIIFTYGAVGYVSWYIFAYQHIMWHSMYDWYIFSLTLGLSFGLLIVLYINMLVDFYQNIVQVGNGKKYIIMLREIFSGDRLKYIYLLTVVLFIIFFVNSYFQKNKDFELEIENLETNLNKVSSAISGFNVYFTDNNQLVFYHPDCKKVDLSKRFFLHAYTSNSEVKESLKYGFRNMDFYWHDYSIPSPNWFSKYSGSCMAIWDLPNFSLKGIRTGQFERIEGKAGPRIWQEYIDLQLLEKLNEVSAFNLTDARWENGISKTGAAFFIANSPINKQSLNTGDTLIFSHSKERVVSRITYSDKYINVFVNGELLNPELDGHSNKIEIRHLKEN